MFCGGRVPALCTYDLIETGHFRLRFRQSCSGAPEAGEDTGAGVTMISR